MDGLSHTAWLGKSWTHPTDDTELWPGREGVTELLAALRLVDKKATAIQAGGGLGIWPYALSKGFERVITLEPNHTNFHCLAANLKDTNVIAYQAALGEFVDTCEWVPNPKKPRTGYTIPGRTHRQTTIDHIAELHEISLIQLDIEGNELSALRGGSCTIRMWHPLIMIEDKTHGHSNIINHTKGEAVDYLVQEFGYRVVDVVGNNKVLK